MAGKHLRVKWLESSCGLAAPRAFQAPNGLKVFVGRQPAGHFKHQMAWKYLRVGSLQGISSTKWLESTCGLAARRAFQAPNGLKVPAAWQPAGHFKHQITKWLESTCGLAARRAFQVPSRLKVPAGLATRRAFQAPNGLKVPAGRQPAGHFKHQITKWLESTSGLAARRAAQAPNGLKVPEIGLQGISSTR